MHLHRLMALLAYAVIKRADASDSADVLQGGFAQAAGAGIPGVQAWAISGVLSRMSSDG
jgi:hypothetical protein